MYWTTCRVTACEPGREVLVGDWMTDSAFTKIFAVLGGRLRTRRNKRDMRKKLKRIKAVEATPE